MIRALKLSVLAGSAFVWLAPQAAAQEGDVAAGEGVFRRCAVCHGIGDTDRPVAPSLNGVIGRTAGTLETFPRYSPAMVAAGEGGLVWNQETMAEYLADPRGYIPGNRMAFPGLRQQQEILDVIAYVATYSDAAEEAAGEGEAVEGEGETEEGAADE